MRLFLNLFVTLFVLSSICYAIDDASLVLYCPFEEGSGNTTTDQASGQIGELRGDAKWTADGKIGNAIEFSTSGDSIEFPEDAIMDITETVTMEAWVYTNAGIIRFIRFRSLR